MKKSMLLVLLLSSILLFPQKMSKEIQQFIDTVDIFELYTVDGKNMFSGNSIISDKTFCNSRMCVWLSVGDFDTLVYKALLNRDFFTGIAENFENETLLGRFTFIDGEMIQSFTTYKDASRNLRSKNYEN